MPRDLTVSSESLQLVEGATNPSPILCTALGYPEPEVRWSLNGEVVSQQQLLEFPDPVDRSVVAQIFPPSFPPWVNISRLDALTIYVISYCKMYDKKYYSRKE